MTLGHNQVVPIGAEIHGRRSKYCFLSLKDLLTIFVGITIPVAIGVYGAVSTMQAQKAARKAADEQHRIATERRDFDLQRSVELHQQQLYKGFLDDMYKLYKDGELNDTADPWVFANARFRAVHRQWDVLRKEQGLEFLKEKELIGRQKCITGCEEKIVKDIIHLNGLNYDFVNLSSQTGSLNPLDLRCIRFDQISMRNATFSDTNLDGATFMKTRLINAQFFNVTLRCVLFNGTEMNGVDLTHTDTTGSRFINIDPSTFKLTDEQRRNVIFEQTDVPTTTLPTSMMMTTENKPKINRKLSTARWSTHGTTIIGNSNNQSTWTKLNHPMGIAYDVDNDIIVVADAGNHRIAEWRVSDTTTKFIAQYPHIDDQQQQIGHPIGILIDGRGDNLIICDTGNYRVIRWPRFERTKSFEILVDNISCIGLGLDSQNRLYVTNKAQEEIIRYQIGESTGVVVAGGNGKGSLLNQLDGPHFIFVDEEYSIYVSEINNHRVTKWATGASISVLVAGGNRKGNTLWQLASPESIFVDDEGTLFILDQNHRITRWLKGSQQGTLIVGGNGYGNRSDQLHSAVSFTFDQWGNLYVSDKENNRIQKFVIEMN